MEKFNELKELLGSAERDAIVKVKAAGTKTTRRLVVGENFGTGYQ